MADPIALRVAARFISAAEPQELLAKEFPSDEALKKYLHEHPKADKSTRSRIRSVPSMKMLARRANSTSSA
jgi:hypothetical protein